MANQRQLERLVQQVQRLPQHDEYWAATSRLARMWITPKRASPYRPYITLVLSQHGKIVSSRVRAHPRQPMRCVKSSCRRCAVRRGGLDEPGAPPACISTTPSMLRPSPPFWRLAISNASTVTPCRWQMR
jgi:hypothetical protein